MKKLIITMMMLASLQGFADGPKAPGQDGGGGGVIKRNGMYLTFGSAGMKVKLSSAQGMEQVPGLELLISVLDSIPLPIRYMGKLMDAVLPSSERNYFRIDKSQLNSQDYARLISEYAKLWEGQIDPTNLDLAAITVGKDTFLLPPYFTLKPQEQAAILFHESLWILKPSIKYNELVTAEMAMQSHIEKYGVEKAYNAELFASLGLIYGYEIPLFAAIEQDVKDGLFEKYKLNHQNGYTLFGALFTVNMSSGHLPMEEQHAEFLMRLRAALKKYPELRTLKVLYTLRNEIKFIMPTWIGKDFKMADSLRAFNRLNEDDCHEISGGPDIGGGFAVCFSYRKQRY